MDEFETADCFEHDDFEASFESSSSDDESCEPNHQQERSHSIEDTTPAPSDNSRQDISPTESMTESWTASPGVPRTVRRVPDSAASVVSDVSGMTELNLMAMSLEQDRSTRIQPRDHRASRLPRDLSIANNCQSGGTTNERLQYAGDLPNRSDAIPSLPTHLEQDNYSDNSSHGKEVHVSEIGSVVNAQCVAITEEEYEAAMATNSAMVAEAQPVMVNPYGHAGPNINAVAQQYELPPVPSSMNASVVSETSPQLQGSSSSNMDASAATHDHSAASSSASRSKTKVVRTTIKKIPARDKPKKKAVRKTTTIAVDGSQVEKIENADGTTTTMIKRTTKRNKTFKQSGESGTNVASSSNASMNSSTTSSSTASRRKHGGTGPSSHGSSRSSNESTGGKKVKRRTTKHSMDGSRIEVTEYTDGSKVTETFTSMKQKTGRRKR